jgi:gluconokinase
MKYIIGIDIGTTNTKAIAYTAEGNTIAQASSTYTPLDTPADRHEMDADVLFSAVCQTIREVTAQADPAFLQGISFSSAMHSLMAVDTDGKPLTNIITWADLRSSKQAAALKDTPTGKLIYQRSGTPVHPMSPLSKLLWMKEEAPELFNATYKFIGIKEYIFYRFFGQYLIDHSIASATGLFDIYDLTWNKEALAITGLTADRLSKPVSTTQPVTGLPKKYADYLGIDPSVPFIIGASDGCLANLGSGAMEPGEMSVTIGTSGAVRMASAQPQHDAKGRIFNYILTSQWYISGGPINNGAVLLNWYAENFLQRPLTTSEDVDGFLQQAATVPAGAVGLIFLPYVQGERAPVWDAEAKGVFFGIQAHHTQAHFMRAIIEGINNALYEVAQSVEETIGPIDRLYASGGFTRSSQWLQWLADLFGKEVIVSAAADASAVGAALLGWNALGITETLALPVRTEQAAARFVPHASQHAVYRRNYAIYTSLYPALKEAFHQPH